MFWEKENLFSFFILQIDAFLTKFNKIFEFLPLDRHLSPFWRGPGIISSAGRRYSMPQGPYGSLFNDTRTNSAPWSPPESSPETPLQFDHLEGVLKFPCISWNGHFLFLPAAAIMFGHDISRAVEYIRTAGDIFNFCHAQV